MPKLTRADVERMKRKDTDNLIFDGKNGLTKRLPIQQIEAIFPDSLLILTDIAYDTDSEGNLCVVSAVVDEFCETTEQASDYINKNCSSYLEGGTPYHTGVTKFNHVKYFTHVGNPNFSKVVEEEFETYVEKDELDFPFSPINTDSDKYCSIKELNFKPLYDFFLNLGIADMTALAVIRSIRQDVSAVQAPELGYEVFVDIIIKNFTQMGYQPTEYFRPALNKLIEESYNRLIKRDRVVIFYNEEDKKYLADYCNANQYKYFFMKSDRYIDLLSVMLQDKVKKVVLMDSTIEKLSVVKAKILGLLAVKCEVKIEVISS